MVDKRCLSRRGSSHRPRPDLVATILQLERSGVPASALNCSEAHHFVRASHPQRTHPPVRSHPSRRNPTRTPTCLLESWNEELPSTVSACRMASRRAEPAWHQDHRRCEMNRQSGSVATRARAAQLLSFVAVCSTTRYLQRLRHQRLPSICNGGTGVGCAGCSYRRLRCGRLGRNSSRLGSAMPCATARAGDQGLANNSESADQISVDLFIISHATTENSCPLRL